MKELIISMTSKAAGTEQDDGYSVGPKNKGHIVGHNEGHIVGYNVGHIVGHSVGHIVGGP